LCGKEFIDTRNKIYEQAFPELGTMRDSEMLFYAAVGLAGLYVYRQFKNAKVGYSPHMDKYELSNRIVNAGGTVTTTSLGTFYNVPGGVIKLDQGAQLRRWETAVLNLDRVVPGDFLTRWVLS
jgi:hypothetical protein